MSRHSVIAYWLIPAEPAHTFFQGIINDLARRYDAPLFEPHVTIHVGANRADSAENALAKAACECKGVTLKALGIDHSDEFIKTLFVKLAFNAELRRLSEIVRRAAQDSPQYGLRPHLSLLYKKMPASARRELAASIKVPRPGITFDALQAIRCVSPTQNRAEVEAWRVLKTTPLSG
jgi:Cyclic phosphodiesterase-like protein